VTPGKFSNSVSINHDSILPDPLPFTIHPATRLSAFSKPGTKRLLLTSLSCRWSRRLLSRQWTVCRWRSPWRNAVSALTAPWGWMSSLRAPHPARTWTRTISPGSPPPQVVHHSILLSFHPSSVLYSTENRFCRVFISPYSLPFLCSFRTFISFTPNLDVCYFKTMVLLILCLEHLWVYVISSRNVSCRCECYSSREERYQIVQPTNDDT
jgi:hypothetical protein